MVIGWFVSRGFAAECRDSRLGEVKGSGRLD